MQISEKLKQSIQNMNIARNYSTNFKQSLKESRDLVISQKSSKNLIKKYDGYQNSENLHPLNTEELLRSNSVQQMGHLHKKSNKNTETIPKIQIEDLKKIKPINKKSCLNEKVFQLIRKRKRHELKFKTEICKYNCSESNININKSDQNRNQHQQLSDISNQSDVQKQVNFLYPDKTGLSHKLIKLDEEEQLNIIYQQQDIKENVNYTHIVETYPKCEIHLFPQQLIPYESDNSALGIFLQILSTHPNMFDIIFTKDYMSQDYNLPQSIIVKVYDNFQQKIIFVTKFFPIGKITPVIMNQKVYIYPLVIEKCLAILKKGYTQIANMELSQIINIFLNTRSRQLKISDSSTIVDMIKYSKLKESYLYLKSNNNIYHKIGNVTTENNLNIEIKFGEVHSNFSYKEIQYFYQKLVIIKNINKLQRSTLHIKHHPNHFCILTLRIFSKTNYYINLSENRQSQSHLILIRLKENSNCEIIDFTKGSNSYLDLQLEQGQYQMYVYNSNSNAKVEILSELSFKLLIKHKIEYRKYTQFIVNSYLKSINFDLKDYQKQLSMLRCKLLIGFWVDIIINPIKQTALIEISYDENALCDTLYQKKQLKLEIKQQNHLKIVLKKDCDYKINFPIKTYKLVL